jgi:hypothetical protein
VRWCYAHGKIYNVPVELAEPTTSFELDGEEAELELLLELFSPIEFTSNNDAFESDIEPLVLGRQLRTTCVYVCVDCAQMRVNACKKQTLIEKKNRFNRDLLAFAGGCLSNELRFTLLVLATLLWLLCHALVASIASNDCLKTTL